MAYGPLSYWLWRLLSWAKDESAADETPPGDRGPADEEGELDDPDDEEDKGELEVPAATGAIRAVGAWTGSSSIANPTRDTKFAKALGLRRIDVMVNDHSKKRQPRDFGTYDRAAIVALCRRLTGEGIAVHLTSWIMPHPQYIRTMGPQLIDLVVETGAKSVCFDAEEPWVIAAGTKGWSAERWDEAGAQVAAAMQAVPFGVTGIGYASKKKLGPLVSRARYMVPQCYSVAGNNLDPRTAAVSLSAGWRKKFGEHELVVGLAGYAQEGRPGYTKDRFMRTAFDAAKAAGATDVVYWSLTWLRKSRSTANIVASLAAATNGRALSTAPVS